MEPISTALEGAIWYLLREVQIKLYIQSLLKSYEILNATFDNSENILLVLKFSRSSILRKLSLLKVIPLFDIYPMILVSPGKNKHRSIA